MLRRSIRLSNEARPLLSFEMGGGFGEISAEDHSRVIVIVKSGEDAQADILRWIRNDANDPFDLTSIAEVHHACDLRGAIFAHGAQRGEVGKQTETRLEVRQVLERCNEVRRSYGADEGDHEQLSRFVGCD